MKNLDLLLKSGYISFVYRNQTTPSAKYIIKYLIMIYPSENRAQIAICMLRRINRGKNRRQSQRENRREMQGVNA